MLTDISLARLAEVHPELKRRIIQLDAMIPSVSLQVTQGLRTWGQQNVLWEQGRTTAGPIVTNAPAGYSSHNFGYAVDIVPEDIMPGQPDWNVSNPGWRKILAYRSKLRTSRRCRMENIHRQSAPVSSGATS